MKRPMIVINEDLCDGCGQCVTACVEGALKIVQGKAKLVREDFCDGLGACLGECPRGALTIETRQAPSFSLKEHGQREEGRSHHETHAHSHHDKMSCPGSAVRHLDCQPLENTGKKNGAVSCLGHWPVQLHLVPPKAPFFKHKELVVLSTCSPVACANIHDQFLAGRSVVVACPKLDRTEPYAEKLASIFSESTLTKVHVVIMEVPCCGGLTTIVKEGRRLSGREDLAIEEHVMGLKGRISASSIFQPTRKD